MTVRIRVIPSLDVADGRALYEGRLDLAAAIAMGRGLKNER